MNNRNVLVKRLKENAIFPFYSREGDAGLDLTAISKHTEGDNIVYGTGIAVCIPKGHVGLLVPRSSVAKMSLSLANSVGIIDSNYRGELIVKFKKTRKIFPKIYNIGDRIAQLVITPCPLYSLTEVLELPESNRGKNGFGSSGK